MVAMTVLAIVVVLLVIACLIWKASAPPNVSEPVDPEQALKAALTLHRIRRNLDTAWTKQEQRRDGTRLRREIAEVLGDDERP
jgi:hypothetical protein